MILSSHLKHKKSYNNILSWYGGRRYTVLSLKNIIVIFGCYNCNQDHLKLVQGFRSFNWFDHSVLARRLEVKSTAIKCSVMWITRSIAYGFLWNKNVKMPCSYIHLIPSFQRIHVSLQDIGVWITCTRRKAYYSGDLFNKQSCKSYMAWSFISNKM